MLGPWSAILTASFSEFNEQFEDMRQFLQEYVFSVTEGIYKNYKTDPFCVIAVEGGTHNN